jgi:hypothetical protein
MTKQGIPYIDHNGTIITPFNADPKYHYRNGGQPYPYDLSAPLQLGIEHSAAQNQCYTIPNDDRRQPIQNSIDQPEGDTDDKTQTEGQAYLMGALEFEKPPYLWDHSHSR